MRRYLKISKFKNPYKRRPPIQRNLFQFWKRLPYPIKNITSKKEIFEGRIITPYSRIGKTNYTFKKMNTRPIQEGG